MEHKIGISESIQDILKNQNVDYDAQLSKLRGISEHLIIENNSLRAKLKLLRDGSLPPALSSDDKDVPNSNQHTEVETTILDFKDGFESEYFSMKDQLLEKDTEIR